MEYLYINYFEISYQKKNHLLDINKKYFNIKFLHIFILIYASTNLNMHGATTDFHIIQKMIAREGMVGEHLCRFKGYNQGEIII